jgi:hypothetical protein
MCGADNLFSLLLACDVEALSLLNFFRAWTSGRLTSYWCLRL